MRRRAAFWSALCAAAAILLLGLNARSEPLEILRNSRLYDEPSSRSDRIRVLHPGEQVTQLDVPARGGYVRVRTAADEEGWVYERHVTVLTVAPVSSPARTRGHAAGPRAAAIARSPTVRGLLEIHVIDVGQGDAILIRCPDGTHQLLIDSGDTRYTGSAAHFKQYLTGAQARADTLEVVVATHPHADHLGSMAWVLREYPVATYVDDGMEYDSKLYRDVEAAWGASQSTYVNGQDSPRPDIDFCPLPEVTARILTPRGFGEDPDPNNNSVVVRVDYRDASFLFVGDAEDEEEGLLLDDLQTRALLDCDFLKVGHHGSDTSSAPAFVSAVSPEVAVISCGDVDMSTNKRYKHPRASTVRTLLSHVGRRQGEAADLRAFDREAGRWVSMVVDKALYSTVQDGDMVFESDGRSIRRQVPALP